jgi:ABC-type polar amino acid transport system ATPase subunit
LSPESAGLVEGILREKQSQGVMIIMALKDINFADGNDHILILDEGVSVEYGKYKDLTKNKNSRISKFLKLK